MIQQLPKAPVNLTTGSIELTIEPNDLLDLKYYNLYADSGGPATVNTGVGNNWTTSRFARGIYTNNVLAFHFSPGRSGKILWFDNSFMPLYGNRATLQHDTVEGVYRVTELNGRVTAFDDFQGRIIQSTEPDGTVTDYLFDPDNQRIDEIQTRLNDGAGQIIVERRQFEYFSEGVNAGQLQRITLGRATGIADPVDADFNPVDADFIALRMIELVYYTTLVPERGRARDLKFVKWQSITGEFGRDIKIQYFRYYTEESSPGFASGLKYALSTNEFNSLLKSSLGSEFNPGNISDADLEFTDNISDIELAPYAGRYFEYDDQRRVSLVRRDGGRVTNQMGYTVNPNPVTDPYNHWFRKATYSQENGLLKTVYSNESGVDILVMDQAPDGRRWIHAYKFNNQGREIEKIYPSAIDLSFELDETQPNLGLRVKPNEGLIEVTEWNEILQRVRSTAVKQGDMGTPVLQSELEYETRIVGTGTSQRSTDVVCRRTVYQSDTDITDTAVTTYTYDWHDNSLQPRRVTTCLPVVSEDQNGMDSGGSSSSIHANAITSGADKTMAEYDELGRMIRQTDERGFKTEYHYDTATGARIKMIQDAGDGGLHIETEYKVDDRGRQLEMLGPAREVDRTMQGSTGEEVVTRLIRTATWNLYEDEYETWTARGYQVVGTDQRVLVNPVQISRRSIDGLTSDSITATIGTEVESTTMLDDLAGGSDPFPRTSWTAWTRNRYDVNGRMIGTRVYHNIPESGEGEAGMNYLETTYEHDMLARQDRMVDPTGLITRTEFDPLSRSQSTSIGTNDTDTDDNDMVILSSYEYDNNLVGDSNMTRSIKYVDNDPAHNRTTRYLFDWRNRGIDTIAVGPNDNNIISRQTYDNRSRVIVSETLSQSGIQELETTAAASPTGILAIDAEAIGGQVLATRTRTFYDDRNRVYRTIRDGVDQQTGVLTDEFITHDTVYDPSGNVLKQTPAGAADFMCYCYDALNRKTASINAVDLEKITTYNDASEVVAQTDELMHTTTIVYDEIGRMLNTVNHLGERSNMSEYDIAGRMSAQIDPFDERTKYAYDDASRQISVTDQDDNPTMTDYDPEGRVKTVTTPSGTTTYGYDFQSHQTSVNDPEMDVTRYVYNRVGEVLEMIDAKGNSTFNEYDILGRMTQVTDRLTGITKYGYDRISRRDSITDADGDDGVTRYGYDAFGRPSTTTYPDHIPSSQPGESGYSIVTLEHDNHDRMFRRTDQQGDTVTYRFDTRGRLIARDYRTRVNGPTGDITDRDMFGYDDADRMVRATSGRYDNTVTLDYDDANRRTLERLEIGGQTYDITTGYDIASRVDQIDYPDGTVVERCYNTRHLLKNVRLNEELVDTRSEYDDSSRLRTCTYGNGVVTTFDYRNDDRVSRIDTINAGTEKVGIYDYLYDANKNKTAETITGGGVMNNFGFDTGATGYDAENRLVNWNRTDGNQDQSWDLSLVGDWDQFSNEGDSTTYEHNAAHELTSVNGQPLGFDAKGNRLGSVDGAVYTWDFDNRLVSVDDAVFEYDALGRRVFENASGGSGGNVLVCSGEQLLAIYALGAVPSSPSRMFVYGSYIDEPILMLSGSQRYYYSRNQQYSITALTDSSGNIVERYRYDAYGNTVILSPTGEVLDQSSVGNVFMYTGRYNHPEIGLMYFRARYYSPQTGEFISRDPLEYVDGMSLYRGYFALGAMDPSGMGVCEDAHKIWTEKCNDDAISCNRRCMRRRPPWWAGPKGSWKHIAYCEAECQVGYLACYAAADTAYYACLAADGVDEICRIVGEAAEHTFDTLAEAAEWLAEHPEVVVGTVVVVAGVAMVVSTGPAGALVLVAL